MLTVENTHTEVVTKELTQTVIASTICGHKELGPDSLESVYEKCLAYELSKRLRTPLLISFNVSVLRDGLRRN
ncbi:MAG TPA: GxxExxY protein [Terrimicrobiaceae bacterium]|nr:GxxExxY protein [Terrimicrobiaceae bacterium]